MTAAARALAAAGLRVARFEFGYMAARRSGARAAAAAGRDGDAGVSRGGGGARGDGAADHRRQVDGRAGRQHGRGRAACGGAVAGLLCLGYPFHPPGRPEQLRTAHLEGLATPALICQGTRDPFGTREEVAGYALSPAIEMLWLEDGDHDLKPRKGVSGFGAADHLRSDGASGGGLGRRPRLSRCGSRPSTSTT